MPNSKEPYIVISPEKEKVPVLVSVPHCGVAFPEEISKLYRSEIVENPDDTDWDVHRLYDFVSELGITMIHAVYSRLVIDLNRDHKNKPLYDDGRIITEVVPKTDFTGKSIYKSSPPDEREIQRRIQNYYLPYHQKIDELLSDLKNEFGKVLIFDAHSIRQYVPTIHKNKFPDLILGDNDGKSAHRILIDKALSSLSESGLELTHNQPFRGGYITRSFGKPDLNQHALQLEMTKVNYMNDQEEKYDRERAENIQITLRSMFISLIETIKSL